MKITIDIETRPPHLDESERYAIAVASKKNPKRTDDTRAAWAQDPTNQLEAMNGLALNPYRGRICVISASLDGGKPETWGHWDDESAVVRAFASWVPTNGDQVYWVGHSIAAFDIVWLREACLRARTYPDVRRLYRLLPLKRFDGRILDNMVEAMGPAGRTMPSAQLLSESAGVTDKGEHVTMDWAALWAQGADCLPELMARCEADVRAEWARRAAVEEMYE